MEVSCYLLDVRAAKYTASRSFWDQGFGFFECRSSPSSVSVMNHFGCRDIGRIVGTSSGVQMQTQLKFYYVTRR